MVIIINTDTHTHHKGLGVSLKSSYSITLKFTHHIFLYYIWQISTNIQFRDQPRMTLII